MSDASTERAQRLFNDEELKVVLLDFVYHLRRISRQAAIFMCSWHSGLIVLPYVFSNFCQKHAEGKCTRNCQKQPKGMSHPFHGVSQAFRYPLWHADREVHDEKVSRMRNGGEETRDSLRSYRL